MCFCAGQPRAQFALFSGLCAARRATNRQGRFLFGFHGLHNGPLRPNKMVNSDQSVTPLSLNNCGREFHPALVLFFGQFGNRPNFVRRLSSSQGAMSIRSPPCELSCSDAGLRTCHSQLSSECVDGAARLNRSSYFRSPGGGHIQRISILHPCGCRQTLRRTRFDPRSSEKSKSWLRLLADEGW
jgi:hypothetical protein